MRPTVPKLFGRSGLVLIMILCACSSGGGTSDAVDAQQTANPEPTPAGGETADAEGDGDIEPGSADEDQATNDPTGDDDGPETIGGEQTGLTLEIPDEWVDLPMDTDAMSEYVADLDLPDDQAVFLESSVGTLGDVDGAIMAIDTSTFGSDFATNVNAYCVPNDGSLGDSNLEAAIELGLEAIAEGIEIESATVDGHHAARATYSLDVPGLEGHGVQYTILADDDICWVTFTGSDRGLYGAFDDIAATISVL